MPTYTFPADLRDAQIALLQARAALEQYTAGHPGSVEPMPGWKAEKQLHSDYRPEKPESAGYTPEQKVEVARLRKDALDLSVTVSTHPFWATVDRGEVVEARMALKRAQESADTNGAA
ncbi:hypothetical protein ACFYY2_31270 [Streptomyces sp. NPDC001822]|uniref:hypothetical protein n=1 Tax=Streptomyces sp. NPDC001822 TaxID=3364614 RepID=UPI00368AB96C